MSPLRLSDPPRRGESRVARTKEELSERGDVMVRVPGGGPGNLTQLRSASVLWEFVRWGVAAVAVLGPLPLTPRVPMPVPGWVAAGVVAALLGWVARPRLGGAAGVSSCGVPRCRRALRRRSRAGPRDALVLQSQPVPFTLGVARDSRAAGGASRSTVRSVGRVRGRGTRARAAARRPGVRARVPARRAALAQRGRRDPGVAAARADQRARRPALGAAAPRHARRAHRAARPLGADGPARRRARDRPP